MRTWSRAPRGAAAVEFALVVPFLLLLVLGTIEWGRYFFTEQVVVNAAREGARAGSVAPGAFVAAATAAAAAALTAGNIDPAKATIDPQPGTGAIPSVIVTVTVPLKPLTGIPVPASATARAEMRR